MLDYKIPNNAFVARTCTVGVVVAYKSNMATYFPEAGNLNDGNVDMCSDVAGPSSSGLSDLFELSDMSNTLTISPTTTTTGCHLGFERDYNSHTAFWAVLHHYA